MTRHICWVDGTASVIAAMFYLKEHPEALLVTSRTGAEDDDNLRFHRDVEAHLGREIIVLTNPDFPDTMSVWRKRRYISGIAGAPCTSELKIWPRLQFQQDGDHHVFGYTADGSDVKRFGNWRKNYPDQIVRAPLIERGITKAACRALMQDLGIREPRTYDLGFPNANCLKWGCGKATAPGYWALHRIHFPESHAEMAAFSREIGCRLVELNGERIFLDELPADFAPRNAVAPACDFLCHINGQDLAA